MASVCMVAKNSFWSLEHNPVEFLPESAEFCPEPLRCRSLSDSLHDYSSCSYGKACVDDLYSLGQASTIDDASEARSPSTRSDFGGATTLPDKDEDEDDDEELVCIDDDDDEAVSEAVGPPGIWATPEQLCVAMVPVQMEQWSFKASAQWLEQWQQAPTQSLDNSVGRCGRRCKRNGSQSGAVLDENDPDVHIEELREVGAWADCSDDE